MLLLINGSREFVKATAELHNQRTTLLSFRKGDIIKVTNTMTIRRQRLASRSTGWKVGDFPVEYVTKIGRTEARLASKILKG
ncbi:hypothetical protein Avbf_07843 [Armadillidium vulgare]|nr:hypothetical protein Avbf_07843 [Armadillidium vulgare]